MKENETFNAQPSLQTTYTELLSLRFENLPQMCGEKSRKYEKHRFLCFLAPQVVALTNKHVLVQNCLNVLNCSICLGF